MPMNQSEYNQMFNKLCTFFNKDVAHLNGAVERCLTLGYERPKKVTLMMDDELNKSLEKASSYVSKDEALRLKIDITNFYWTQISTAQQFAYIQRAQDMFDNHKFD